MRQVPADVVGATSTAPCPRETAQAALCSGLSRLVEVYGASETSGIGWRDDADGLFALFGHWRPGAEADTLVRIAPDGTSQSVPLPDRLAWFGERAFRVEGRRDEAVQVGGINVFPSVVREHLLQHPGVRDAAVRLMSPGEGVRLKAFIAPKDPSLNVADLRRDVTAWCDARLSVPERPKAFSFGPELPRNAMHKLADWPVLGDPQ
jgi:4-coumarate--CoA ligase (photoactive yellow protein activation family)